MQNNEHLYSLSEAAEILRIHPQTLKNAIENGLESAPYKHPTGFAGYGIPKQVLVSLFGGTIEPVFSTEEVAQKLGLERDTVTKLCIKGRIPAIRVKEIKGVYRIKASVLATLQGRRRWESWE